MSLRVPHGIGYMNECTQSHDGEVRQNNFHGEGESKALDSYPGFTLFSLNYDIIYIYIIIYTRW